MLLINKGIAKQRKIIYKRSVLKVFYIKFFKIYTLFLL